MKTNGSRPGRCRAGAGADVPGAPAGAHLASWAGRTPLDNSSGKRTGRAKAKKGNRYLSGLPGETAVAAGKTQTRDGARYPPPARRPGKATDALPPLARGPPGPARARPTAP